MKPVEFNQFVKQEFTTKTRKIYSFEKPKENIDLTVVNSFGDEWKKFYRFTDEEINKLGVTILI